MAKTRKNPTEAGRAGTPGSPVSRTQVPGLPAADRIPPELRAQMARTIARYGGSEVLFVGVTDPDGRITSIKDHAHGNEGMVPVPKIALEAGMVLIHNHPSGRLIPSDADLGLAGRMSDEGIGSWIVDNEVERLYPIIEAQGEEKSIPLEVEELAAILGSGGGLSKVFSGFQVRDGQVAMLRTVARAFNEDAIAAIEAGTGIGKSFAYLLPAALWALQNKERVVISTATINLQQQLIEKDIPLLSRLLGREIKAVLAKGRGNYVCIKRLGEALDEDSLLREEDSELGRLQEWMKTTKDGSKSDLGMIPGDLTWSRINADADACSGMVCSKRDQCFFFRARREAASSHLVVANHHLVFADAAMRSQGLGFESSVVLPAFQRLIFDEAHNIENSAVDFFALTMNRWMLFKYLNLFLRRRKGRVFGALPLVLQALNPQEARIKKLTVEDFEERMFDLREAMRLTDEAALSLMGGEQHVRLVPAMTASLEGVMAALGRLQMAMHAMVQAMEDLLKQLDAEEKASDTPGLVDLGILVRRVSSLAATCDTFRNYQAETDRVLWIQRERLDKGEVFAHFTACPLDISPRLRESVFQPYPTVVMCSATLTVGGDFDWWARRLGLFARKPGDASRSSLPGPGSSGFATPESPGESALDYKESDGFGQDSWTAPGLNPGQGRVKDEWSGYDSSWSDWESLDEGPRSASQEGGTIREDGFEMPGQSGQSGQAGEDRPGRQSRHFPGRASALEPEVLELPWMDRTFLRIRLDSPFDYANRVMLAIPADAPEPSSPGYQAYLNLLVTRILTGSGGHALVLFTSYDMLMKTWEVVKPRLDEAGIPAYRQGDMERSRLLRTFNAQVASCLFATESFWEGVDSPGDALQVLILCKLPFKVPTEPLQLARSEAIEARGGKAFMELSVPEAVMKFRQGFGRLMRRQEDYGLVIIPDKRLSTKAYGRIFLNSLPKTRTCQAPTEEMADTALEFLHRLRRESSRA